MRLRSLGGHGAWGGVDVLAGLEPGDGSGAIAVVTHARVRRRHWPRFTRATYPVDVALRAGARGCSPTAAWARRHTDGRRRSACGGRGSWRAPSPTAARRIATSSPAREPRAGTARSCSPASSPTARPARGTASTRSRPGCVLTLSRRPHAAAGGTNGASMPYGSPPNRWCSACAVASRSSDAWRRRTSERPPVGVDVVHECVRRAVERDADAERHQPSPAGDVEADAMAAITTDGEAEREQVVGLPTCARARRVVAAVQPPAGSVHHPAVGRVGDRLHRHETEREHCERRHDLHRTAHPGAAPCEAGAVSSASQ